MQNHVFKLQPSKIYLILSGLVIILGLAALFFTSIPFWLKIILTIIFSIYGWHNLNVQGMLQGRDSLVSLRRLESGEWLVKTPTQEYTAELCGDSTVTHLVSVLRFKAPVARATFSSVIFSDSLPNDEYRRLLVLLRMY